MYETFRIRFSLAPPHSVDLAVGEKQHSSNGVTDSNFTLAGYCMEIESKAGWLPYRCKQKNAPQAVVTCDQPANCTLAGPIQSTGLLTRHGNVTQKGTVGKFLAMLHARANILFATRG